MRLSLFSEKNKPDSIKVLISGIFERELLLNYVKIDDDYIVIPTGKWKEDIEIARQAKINGKNYVAEIIDISGFTDAFINKYGKEHFDRYFKDSEWAVLLRESKDTGINDYETIGKYFDRIAEKYSVSLSNNQIQQLMRGRVIEVISKYIDNGDSILDMGAGSSSEVLQIDKAISVTEVDVSRKMLELSRAYNNPGNKKIDYILLRDLENIKGKFDVIFSTFGFLNIESPANIRKIVDNHLRDGGYFIGAYMNTLCLTDALLSVLLGRFRYLRERLSGRISSNFSRYGMLSYPRGPSFIRDLGFDDIEYIAGICTLFAPYNFEKLNRELMKVPLLAKIDSILSGMPMLWAYSDFTVFVARR